MKFDRVYARFLNIAARLFGGFSLFVGIFSLGCAFAFEEDRGMRVVAGISSVAVGIAVFFAKPFTVEQLDRMRQRMEHGG